MTSAHSPQTATRAYQRDVEQKFAPFSEYDDAIIVAATLATQASIAPLADMPKMVEGANQLAADVLLSAFSHLPVQDIPAAAIELRPLRVLAIAIKDGLPNLAAVLARAIIDIELRDTLSRGPSNEAEQAVLLARYDAALGSAMPGYKDIAQPGLCGLTQNQFVELCTGGDWLTTGPFRLDTKLPLADFVGAKILRDARAALSDLRAEHEPEETEKVNLPRRLLLEAGLIVRRDERLRITKDGRLLAEEHRAGELFAKLFVTLFRDLSLWNIDRSGSDERGLNTSVPACLYLLGIHGRRYESIDFLTAASWPPAMRDDDLPLGGGTRSEPERTPHTYRMRMLRPLTWYGLLERREGRGASRPIQYRTTPLFRRFFHFEVTSRPPVRPQPGLKLM